jgi:excisionase family DNA binding protein
MNQQIILNGLTREELVTEIRTIVNDAVSAIPKAEKIKPYLSLAEASDLTGLSKPTLYRLTSQKQIPHIKRGGKLLFNRQELVAWLQSANQPLNKEA